MDYLSINKKARDLGYQMLFKGQQVPLLYSIKARRIA